MRIVAPLRVAVSVFTALLTTMAFGDLDRASAVGIYYGMWNAEFPTALVIEEGVEGSKDPLHYRWIEPDFDEAPEGEVIIHNGALWLCPAGNGGAMGTFIEEVSDKPGVLIAARKTSRMTFTRLFRSTDAEPREIPSRNAGGGFEWDWFLAKLNGEGIPESLGNVSSKTRGRRVDVRHSTIPRGRFGFRTSPVGEESQRIRIEEIFPNTAASESELRVGDVIFHFDQTVILSSIDFDFANQGKLQREACILTVRRGDEDLQVTIQPRPWPGSTRWTVRDPAAPRHPRSNLYTVPQLVFDLR